MIVKICNNNRTITDFIFKSYISLEDNKKLCSIYWYCLGFSPISFIGNIFLFCLSHILVTIKKGRNTICFEKKNLIQLNCDKKKWHFNEDYLWDETVFYYFCCIYQISLQSNKLLTIIIINSRFIWIDEYFHE